MLRSMLTVAAWAPLLFGCAESAPGPAPMPEPEPDRTLELYDPDVVQRMDLEISSTDLQAMHDALPERIYVPGTFRWRDVELTDVGIRYKGNSSSSPTQMHKRSFLIKFSEFVSGQRFLGLRRVALDNAVQFGSLFSERILGDILTELGVTVSRSNYATVYLNGVFVGVYVNVERIDKSFLSYHFRDAGGNLYKADTGGPGIDLVNVGTDPALYTQAFELKTNKSIADHTDIVELIENINDSTNAEFDVWLADHFNRTEFDQLLPALLLGGAFDQYTGFNAHNYYLYHEPAADRWHYLVWDLDVGFADNAFGQVPVIDGWDASYPIPVWSERPLIQRIIDDPVRLADYRVRAADQLERYFRPQDIASRIDALYAQIEIDLGREAYPPGRITVPSDTSWQDTLTSLKAFAQRRYDVATTQLASPASMPPNIPPPGGGDPMPGASSAHDPSNLMVLAVTVAGVELGWTDNATDEVAFIVQRCGGSACANYQNAMGLPGQNITGAVDAGVMSSQTYRYRVYAVRPGVGGTGPSNEVEVTVP